jgi:glycolate oxidase FAD binding subunit
MTPIHEPLSEEAAARLVQVAALSRSSLAIRGGGTRGLNAAPDGADILSTRGLTGIVAYNPAEMTMTARAGTPLEVVEAALAENRQMLAFEPCDLRGALGSSGIPTIGGVFATNASGPRRFVAGAARDSLLGVRFVNGKGEVVKAGGRVMKNVTGLDLAKVLAGSHGSLALHDGGHLPRAAGAGNRRHHRHLEPQRCGSRRRHGDGHVDVGRSLRRRPPAGKRARPFRRRRSAGWRGNRAAPRRPRRLGRVRAEKLAASMGQLRPRRAPRCRNLTPASGAKSATPRPMPTARRARSGASPSPPSPASSSSPRCASKPASTPIYDWQGGLVWLRMEADPEAALLRRYVKAIGGGHATLLRARPEVHGATETFEPQADAVAALSARVKASFDPAGLYVSPLIDRKQGA